MLVRNWRNNPFFDPKHTKNHSCSEDGKRKWVERQIEFLRICEQITEGRVVASNYGGCPRIWQEVVAIGMGSAWPYWEPRPTVIVRSTLGNEWFDWTSLTGAEFRGSK
jgi:lipoprotein-anchoring transpeptidase ErfK/SrfK